MRTFKRKVLALLLLGGVLCFPAHALACENPDPPTSTTLAVSVNVGETGLTRTTTYDWSVSKSVSPSSIELGSGESGTVVAKVVVTPTSTDADKATVSGNVVVVNTGGAATGGLAIGVTLQASTGGAYSDVKHFTVNTSSFPVIGVEEDAVYDWSADFTPVAGATYRVVTTVTISNYSGHEGNWSSTSEADISLPSTPSSTEVVDGTVTLTSDAVVAVPGFEITSNFAPQTFSAAGTYSFNVIYKNVSAESSKSFTSGDTVTLVEADSKTKHEASAVVNVATKKAVVPPPVSTDTTPAATTTTTDPDDELPYTGANGVLLLSLASVFGGTGLFLKRKFRIQD